MGKIWNRTIFTSKVQLGIFVMILKLGILGDILLYAFVVCVQAACVQLGWSKQIQRHGRNHVLDVRMASQRDWIVEHRNRVVRHCGAWLLGSGSHLDGFKYQAIQHGCTHFHTQTPLAWKWNSLCTFLMHRRPWRKFLL